MEAQVGSKGSKWAALETNWRRVASTHTLQELMTDVEGATGGRPNIKLLLLGALLVLAGVASLAATVFSMLVAPLLPFSRNSVIAAIQADKYYHLVIPLSIPVTIFTVFLNWFSMKLFKHNS